MPATAASQFPFSSLIQSMAHTPPPSTSSDARQPLPPREDPEPITRASQSLTLLHESLHD